MRAGFALGALWAVAVLLSCQHVSVSAVIIMMSPDNTTYSFEDADAAFGGIIPSMGLRGTLRRAIPFDACEALVNPTAPGESAFALVRRGNCLFDVKAMNAQRAGYVALVVYNNEDNHDLITMSGRHMWDVFIPAVFVTLSSGLSLLRLIDSQPFTLTVILPSFDNAAWSLVTASLVSLLSISLVLTSFLFIRRHRLRMALAAAADAVGSGRLSARQEPPGLTEEEVKALPEFVFSAVCSGGGRGAEEEEEEARDPECGFVEGSGGGVESEGGGAGLQEGETEEKEGRESGQRFGKGKSGMGQRRRMETCAICLEDFEHGERLRVLPCGHGFHSCCVDQWLTTRQPFCPVCKRDAHPTHTHSSPSPSSSTATTTTATATFVPASSHPSQAIFLMSSVFLPIARSLSSSLASLSRTSSAAAAAIAGGSAENHRPPHHHPPSAPISVPPPSHSDPAREPFLPPRVGVVGGGGVYADGEVVGSEEIRIVPMPSSFTPPSFTPPSFTPPTLESQGLET